MSTIPEYIKEAAEEYVEDLYKEYKGKGTFEGDVAAIANKRRAFEDFIAGATSEVAKRYAGETGWIKIEQAGVSVYPDEKVFVLLFHPLMERPQIGYLYNGKWIMYGTSLLPLSNFTHWQPLPANPEK